MDRHASGTRKGARRGTRDSEGLWDWNLVSNRIHFSPGWIALAGCQDHELGNTPDDWFQRVHPEDGDQLRADIAAVRADGASDFDFRYRLRHKDGTYRWMSSRGLVIRNDGGAAIRMTGTQTDVTVETVTDRLTGLPNRLLLLDRLTQSIDRARRHSTFRFALIIIDLGRPADSGHMPRGVAGDALLNAAARRLETCLRMPETMPDLRQNDLVARVGGDTFAVLLDGLSDLAHAKVVADRLLTEMLEPFSLNGRELRLTPTIGIAVSASNYSRADAALRDAETALHRAQALGGSHCEMFDSGVLRSEESELQLEGDFEPALQRREFELVYQPVVSIASTHIVGFEALVRWRHPMLGVIAPSRFIPIAERTGFIVPLGRWILREACAQLRAWHTGVAGSSELWVSVNLSGVQLRHPDLVDHIDESLRESEIEARNLVLELTEGIAMENPTAVATLLMRLRAMGTRISIDDFGTGYSSLAYLRQLPVDALKIDQSFVRGLENGKDTAAIVASIVAMAKRLGLHVVAEGIENEKQLGMLRSLHCESAQGYLFSEPLDATSAGDLLKSAQPLCPDVSPDAAGVAAFTPEGLVQQWMRTALAPRFREIPIAAAVLLVLLSAGVGALFYGRDHVPAAPAGGAQSASPKPETHALEPRREPATTPSAQASSPPASASPSAGARPAASAAAKPVTPAPKGPAADVPVASRASTPKPSAATSAPAPQRSFDVVHLHRMGNCRGALRVSRTGLEFVPQDASRNDDAVSLKHTDFIYAVEGKTLVVKSANKTYRFNVADAQENPRVVAMSDIEAAMARARQ